MGFKPTHDLCYPTANYCSFNRCKGGYRRKHAGIQTQDHRNFCVSKWRLNILPRRNIMDLRSCTILLCYCNLCCIKRRKEGYQWIHEGYWVETQDHRYVCLFKFCVNSPHTINGKTVFFELTNMFSFSTKEHKEPLSARKGIVKLFVLH